MGSSKANTASRMPLMLTSDRPLALSGCEIVGSAVGSAGMGVVVGSSVGCAVSVGVAVGTGCFPKPTSTISPLSTWTAQASGEVER